MINSSLVYEKHGRITHVVYKEHTLGYMYENIPGLICFHHTSILRGSNWSDMQGWTTISSNSKDLRLATAKDFDDYRVCLPSDFIEAK